MPSDKDLIQSYGIVEIALPARDRQATKKDHTEPHTLLHELFLPTDIA